MKSAKTLLVSIYKAAVESAHPKTLIRHQRLSVSNHPLILGAGKAAGTMAESLLEFCKPSESSGCVIVPEGERRRLGGIEVVEGSHPLPSQKSLQATRRLLGYLKDRTRNQEIVFLLSGGASSLLEEPFQGITLGELRRTTQLFLERGATIQEMNVVRKHLSTVKGGRLAIAMGSARCVTVVLSDVQGDQLETVGSGPTYPDSCTFEKALEIVRRRKLQSRVPASVWRFLIDGAAGLHPETPKRDHPVFKRHKWILLGNSEAARAGAMEKAKNLRMRVRVLPDFPAGEAQELGKKFARIAKRLASGSILVASGEPTVRVVGKGKGGRCQEVALSFAIEAAGAGRELCLLAAGTDGIDGPTDAAGAFATNRTTENALKLGMNPAEFLKRNDSYTFFNRLGGLIRTGPTGTNVNDLFLLYVP